MKRRKKKGVECDMRFWKSMVCVIFIRLVLFGRLRFETLVLIDMVEVCEEDMYE